MPATKRNSHGMANTLSRRTNTQGDPVWPHVVQQGNLARCLIRSPVSNPLVLHLMLPLYFLQPGQVPGPSSLKPHIHHPGSGPAYPGVTSMPPGHLRTLSIPRSTKQHVSPWLPQQQ